MLDSRYRPVKISYLGADRILLLLFDTINEKPVLALINQDGQIVRILDDQGSLPGGSDLEKSSALKLDDSAPESFKQVAMAGTLTGWQFGRAGNYLLMLKPGTDVSIWSLSPGGEIRKIKLKMPPGTTASSLTSSDRAWLSGRSSSLRTRDCCRNSIPKMARCCGVSIQKGCHQPASCMQSKEITTRFGGTRTNILGS